MRRDKAQGTDQDKFKRAVHRLHGAIFNGYKDWCHHVELPQYVPDASYEFLRKEKLDLEEWELLLDELSLYFLVYSEAANLRHLPEGLWFLYWCLRNSKTHWNRCNSIRETKVATLPRKQVERMDLRHALRKKFHPYLKHWRSEHLDMHIQADQHSLINPTNNIEDTLANLNKMKKTIISLVDKIPGQLQPIIKGGNVQEMQDRLSMLAELIVFGDGGGFLEHIVQPIFLYLADQVSVKALEKVEIAARVAYDDCNECFCRADNVHRVLATLGVETNPRTLQVIFKKGDPIDVLDRTGNRQAKTQGGLAMPSSAPVSLSFDASHACDFYRHHVFGKTFVERRSLWSVYRSFFRVWMFLILEFEMMAVATWGLNDWNAWAAVPMTHAALCLLEQFAGAWTQRSPHRNVRVVANPFWGHYAKGVLDWLLINAILWLAFVCQEVAYFSFDIWYYIVAGYSGLVVFHALAITRNGYCISITYSIGNMFRRWAKSSGCCYWLWMGLAKFTEWCGASSARPRPTSYLAPYPMKVAWSTFFANAAFWITVLGIKGVFDWYAIMATIEKPILGLWDKSSADWNESTGLPLDTPDQVVKLLNIIMCIARAGPGFLVMMSDMQIFYYIVMAMVGLPKGLLQLSLGSITSFQELVSGFGEAPFQWWKAGVSKVGKANLEEALGAPNNGGSTGRKSSVGNGGGDVLSARMESGDAMLKTDSFVQTTNAIRQKQPSAKLYLTSTDAVAKWLMFSDVWNAIINELRECDLVSDVEKKNLLFVHLIVDDSVRVVEGMRPIILPVFFYGGQVAQAIESPSDDPAQELALSEIRALMVWMLYQLEIINEEQHKSLLEFAPLKKASHLKHRRARSETVNKMITLLKAFKGAMGKADGYVAEENRNTLVRVDLQTALVGVAKIVKQEAEAVRKAYRAGNKNHSNALAVLSVMKHLLGEDYTATTEGTLSPDNWGAFVLEAGGLDDIYNGSPPSSVKTNMMKVVSQILNILETSSKAAQPRGEEANRVLAFFMGSLRNPTLEEPPAVEDMLSFNTLTPHYEEDVIYAVDRKATAKMFGLDENTSKGLSDLVSENEDGVTTAAFLRSFYDKEWKNLIERLNPKIKKLERMDPSQVTEADFCPGGDLAPLSEELVLWASHRGQLLARTVRGMMAYENALRRLATAENLQIPEKYRTRIIEDLVRSKFTYVVASQVYGKNKNSSSAKGRWMAHSIDTLLLQYSGLRVAYLDAHRGSRGDQQYAVLIRGRVGMAATERNCTEELYRVRLPLNKDPRGAKFGVILGEGKPENQNAAIIFCFGEVIQAIDMNQDNFLAEAFKMRNLIGEFNAPAYNSVGYNVAAAVHAGQVNSQRNSRRTRNMVHLPPVTASTTGDLSLREGVRPTEPPFPNMSDSPVALVGFREYVFSADSGALAGFAAATEFTFGSIVQRIMTWPGGVRFHYGHPDLWNKLFVMTRGGMSKATKAFHISEDVFAGYNATLRGGKTKFKEYTMVGKGRDMGFDSINGFESKVSGGNGEQVISRDVHRIATRLDFFRLLAFYCSGPGFFISTYFVLLSVYVNLWMLVLIALTGSGQVSTDTEDDISTLTGQPTSVSVQQIIQIGMFSIITYFMEMILEYGALKALGTLVLQIIQGSIAFFVFRARTTAFFFKSDVLYGGAKYVATGRGYALKHNSFVWVYTNYARSHLYYALELLLLLIILALSRPDSYAATTWSSWLVCISILWAPFWCNPFQFELDKVKDDWDEWRLWMKDVTDLDTNTTWTSWNKGQLERPRDDARVLLNPVGTALRGIGESIPTAIVAVAALIELRDMKFDTWATAAVISAGFWGWLMLIRILKSFLRRQIRLQRIMETLMATILLAYVVCVTLLNTCGHDGGGFLDNCDIGSSIRNMVFISFANFSLAHVVTQVLLYAFSWSMSARTMVDNNYRMVDWTVGYFYFLFLLILAFIQVFSWVQATLLFNLKFSKKLEQAKMVGNNVASYADRAIDRMKKNIKEAVKQEMDHNKGEKEV